MWNLEFTDKFEIQLVDNVIESLEFEEIERGVLGSFRSGIKADVCRSIIGSYVLGVHHSRNNLLNIDVENCPYSFSYEPDSEIGSEDAHYLLKSLCEPPHSYFRITGRQSVIGGPEGRTYTNISIVANEVFERLVGRLKSLAWDTEGGARSEIDGEHSPQSAKVRPPDEPKSATKELDHSKPLDVHTWSEHSEVNKFVDDIFDTYIKTGNVKIQKKHLKVLLLDMYINWCENPDLKTSFFRDVNSYKPKTRYNQLNISKTTVSIVDILLKQGLIEQAIGFKDRGSGVGRTTRIWPTATLTEKFADARFHQFDIGPFRDKEVIVLRDADRSDMEYTDTAETSRMRTLLTAYNELLRKTYIDIPSLKTNWITYGADQSSKSGRLYITQNDKFVRRIFNRETFEKGGRFYGGWWQRCPSMWREKIFLDNRPSVEVDYSGLHIVLLYAEAKIDYWKEVGTDPYTIAPPDFVDSSEMCREICKGLVLTALNAKDENSAFSAFRQQAASNTVEKTYKNSQLKEILDSLRKKHTAIAEKFASDAGVDLMNLDGKITEIIISHFTDQNIPILTVHDSYIVPDGYEDELAKIMNQAFYQTTGVKDAQLKQETESYKDINARHQQRSLRDPARNSLYVAELQRRSGTISKRYSDGYALFQAWLRNEASHH